MEFKLLPKLNKGDKVAILSPSFAAPGRWPEVYKLGLKRLRDIFDLQPIEYPTTSKIGASKEERSKDLIDAFKDPDIKAVISTFGGDDQVTYVRNLPNEPFINNPKPFFGYSDNTHFQNFLWLNSVPSYYGGCLFTQFAMNGEMDEFTIKYLKLALFAHEHTNLEYTDKYNDIGLSWNDTSLLTQKRLYEDNEGWYWNGETSTTGITWGGCLESIDELLKCDLPIPTLDQFKNIVLFVETSEEILSSEFVYRLFRALGERGILKRIKGVLVGRPKAWEFDKPNDTLQKQHHKKLQRETIIDIVRQYNQDIPIIQNMDFGHTDPQICLPNGQQVTINSQNQTISINF